MSKKGHTKKGEKQITPASQGTAADRVDHRVPIQLLVDYKADGHYLFDFCRDLGTGGVFIETKTPLNTGSEIDLTFTIPDSKETLRTKGTVIWSQAPITGRTEVKAGMGIQFSKFSDSQRKTLSDFLSRYGGKNTGGPNQRRAS